MAIPTYASTGDLKQYIEVDDNIDDGQIDLVVSSVSRWVDRHCGRQFWLDDAVTTRTYEARNRYQIGVDDIGVSSGVIVKTDNAGDGTFETTWTTGTFQLLPSNAPYGPEPEPWTEIRAIGGGFSFPLAYSSLQARRDRVQITARFGWPQVPDAVIQATLLQASRVFKRRYSPEGVAGFGQFGAVRFQPLDVDVAELLADYRLGSEVVPFA